ncbi:MAG: OmpH family outer membrane protein [Verrucomicrobiota bacterium]
MMNPTKRMILAALAAGCLCLPASAQTRIATVNLQKVFDKYWKTEQAVSALKESVAEMEKSHKEMLEDWKKMKESYQKLVENANNQAVSTEQRDKYKKDAEEKLADIKRAEDGLAQFERQAGATISEKKARMRKNLLEEIKTAINSKAKSGSYAIVLDSGSQTYAADPAGPYYTPNLLYWSEENDLTDAVIAQLNAGAPVDTSGEKTAPAKKP